MNEPTGPFGQQPGGLSPDERTWGGAAHWSALVAAFVALAFLGPVLVFLIKGNDSPYIRRQALSSLNFQLSMLIYGAIGTIAGMVVVFATLGVALLAVLPLAAAFALLWLTLTIIGSVKASNGEVYDYPLTIRIVS